MQVKREDSCDGRGRNLCMSPSVFTRRDTKKFFKKFIKVT